MLKVFRDNLKYLSWVLWAVIAVFILFVFVDFGATVPSGTGAPTDTAAVVGPYRVSYGEFQRAYRNREDQLREQLGEQYDPQLARQIGLPLQVLNSLVDGKILLAEARKMGLQVTDGELRRYLLEQFQGQDGRFVGGEIYSRYVRSLGYPTTQDFEDAVRNQLLTAKVYDVLAHNLWVADDEVEETYKERVERAKIRFLVLSGERFRDQIEPTDEELAAHFEAHQDEFRIPEQRVVDYLVVDPEELRATLELDPAELSAYYEQSGEEFATEEQVKARHILVKIDAGRTEEEAGEVLAAARQRLEAGEEFAAVAAELSDDPGSKERGGDLGFFGRGRMVPEFEEAAFAGEPGELVGPVRTAFGLHLIQVEERREGGRRPFAEVEDEIRERLVSERSRTLAESRAGELAARLRREGTEAAALAVEQPGVRHQTTPAFGREDEVPGIGRATAFSVAAFELEPGGVSDPVRVAGDWAVLALKEVREPRLPALDEVRSQVEAALVAERQEALARQRLEEARRALEGGKSLDDVAAELELEVEESGLFGARGTVGSLGPAPAVAAAALALDEGGIGGPLPTARGLVLFEVSERKRFDPELYAQEEPATRENLRGERLNQMMGALLAQRREELEVTYDPQLLANFAPDQAGP